LQKKQRFFQRIEKPSGYNLFSWVFQSVGDFLFGCGSSMLGVEKNVIWKIAMPRGGTRAG
jgi:hypothetical protein